MPKPREGESRGDFMKRSVPAMVKQGMSQKQATAKCTGMFSKARRGGMAKAARGQS